MVDEAHATGILGATGRGTLEYFNLEPVKDIDIIMGTLSKALGSMGGFAVGSKNLIRYLRVASRSYMFSTAMSPASVAGAIAALEIIQKEPIWRERLWENSKYLKEKLQAEGFNTLNSETQIIPILIGDDDRAIRFSRILFEKGFFVPCVRWPAVERGKARVRITVMANHTKEQIDALVRNCKEVGRLLQII